MRYRHLGWLLTCTWLGLLPVTARADAFFDARKAVQEGDLNAAQDNLRNAVRADPQNAEAHFWLARISLDLGDPTTAEREVRAAQDRGFDVHETVPLLAQSMLAQQKFNDLLGELQPGGKDAVLDAAILVARGYAQNALKQTDQARASFELAEKTAPNAVQPLLAGARLLALRGDLDGAVAKIDRAIHVQPKSIEAWLAKAELVSARGNIKGALAMLDQMLTEQPAALTVLLARAGLLIAANQPDEAMADLDTVLRATPGNIQATYLQAVIQVQSKDYKAADATLEKIDQNIAVIPRGYVLRAIVKEQLGQTAQAEAAARRSIAREPNDVAAYKVLARIELTRRRPDIAADTLGSIVETGHGDAEAYDLLGRAYGAAGRGEEAVHAFQRAASLAPNDVGLLTRLASARVGMGRPESAIGDLEHALQLAPTEPQVGEALFLTALATGDLRRAEDAVNKVRSAQGDTPVVETVTGLLKLAQLDVDDAGARFLDVVQKHPDFVAARINLARVTAMQGRMADAEQLLFAILDKTPSSEPALTMLSGQMMQSGRMPQAIALIEKAHVAQPTNTRLTASLGDLYIRAGKPAEALDLVDQDRTAADNLDLLNLRAAALLALDRKVEAREAYAQILRIDPSLLAVRRQIANLLLDAGDFELARNIIQAGLAASPRTYQLYQDRAMVDLKATGVDAALATAQQIQQREPDFSALRALIGDVYMAANRPADAVRAFQEALTTAPSGMLVGRLTAALLRDGQNDAAIKVLADWIAQHPDDMAAVRELSDLYIAAGRYEDAVKHLLLILNDKPHDALALNNLAWVYQQQGDKRATSLAKQAYILSPGGQAADTLGWILVSDGDAARGLVLLRQAAAQVADDPRIQYHYAVALKQTGKRDEAVRLLQAVVANTAEFGEKADAQKLLDELVKG
jgi:cellulose synthase operon protein C